MTPTETNLRHAATVVLVRAREGSAVPEVFMVKRHRNSGFMASAYVYPGGKLDAEDSAPELLAKARGMDASEALRRLEGERAALAPSQLAVHPPQCRGSLGRSRLLWRLAESGSWRATARAPRPKASAQLPGPFPHTIAWECRARRVVPLDEPPTGQHLA